MGITGLLPFLKKASTPINIKEFRGYTVAVDTYCWLHKSSYACAMDLALGNPTDQYVRYTLKYLEMILSYNIKPILVFDGANLPSKAETECKRRENKEVYRKKAAEYLLQGNREAAQECFQRSVFVTPKMAQDVLLAARNLGVDCIVAPYEADAQLAYLNRAGYADIIITEDSDLLLFGCRQVIFKLDLTGAGVFVAVSAGIGEMCCGMRPNQFNESTLRFMGILSGCDYFSGIPGIGLATAAKILRQTRLTDFRELLMKLGLYVNLNAAALASIIPANGKDKSRSCDDQSKMNRSSSADTKKYLHMSVIDAAVRAERTFRLQVVFDPRERCQRRLSEPTPEDITDEMRLLSASENDDDSEKENMFSFAGRIMSDNGRAFQIALGNICFQTGTTLGEFNPDNTRLSGQLSRPHSENSLLNYNFEKATSTIANGRPLSTTRPVLGNLGTNTNSVAALMRPNQARLRTSIWNSSFPLQKVWIHRQSNKDDGQPSIRCLSISPSSLDSSDTDRRIVSNGETIATELSEEVEVSGRRLRDTATPMKRRSTQGKKLFVPFGMPAGLQTLRRSPGDLDLLPPLAKARKRCMAAESKTENEDDILRTYEEADQTRTPTAKLMERNNLSSSILTSSNYFPAKPTENSLLCSQKVKVDDVASALNNALNEGETEAPQLNTAHSPVFHRNPFSINKANAVATPPSSPLIKSSLAEQLRSPTMDGIPVTVGLRSTPPGNCCISSGSPTFPAPCLDPTSCNSSRSGVSTDPPLEFTSCSPSSKSDELDIDDVSPPQLSPSFLSSHISQSASNEITPVHDKPLSQSVPKFETRTAPLPMVNHRVSQLSTAMKTGPKSKGRPSSTRNRSLNLKSSASRPSVSAHAQNAVNADLRSFFKQWQFPSANS
ncbi:unnamed protein product [Calicophoron daubneyi]|uniref:Exonuclease 1 n=1 Tax=Calicophoron daubneyi TaxID=300641 RepID=A0AAV2TKT2_CALDB